MSAEPLQQCHVSNATIGSHDKRPQQKAMSAMPRQQCHDRKANLVKADRHQSVGAVLAKELTATMRQIRRGANRHSTTLDREGSKPVTECAESATQMPN
ncbi:hypothetical protein Nepgr_027254 [Nepenthes gracilis]|uniref:Uncharacterized protein n=1 Tax=Nepenthes gracilis TaxID=150966 RepID=A0AAD3Y3D2_NEPGR|nr:hypothetical protein Nepgr_027254 [Nepenthes gracilis]